MGSRGHPGGGATALGDFEVWGRPRPPRCVVDRSREKDVLSFEGRAALAGADGRPVLEVPPFGGTALVFCRFLG